jgi:3-hydroxyisobutyrate dehydrogenase-like beta-hydroxyacid dehydrogenase
VNYAVGIIGLGIMGGSIARLLSESGYKVFGFDLDLTSSEKAQSVGVIGCNSVAHLFECSDVVLTSLPSGEALIESLNDLVDCKKSIILIELSTLSLEIKQKAHEISRSKNIEMLDCPISGTGAQAIKGDLVIYASGKKETFDSVANIFKSFSRICHYVGPFGTGTKLKLAANLMVAIHNAAAAEAINLAQVTGVDNDIILNLLGAGAGSSKVFDLRAPMMIKRSYLPATMKLSTWKKDLSLIADLAASFDGKIPLFSQTFNLYEELALTEEGTHDTAAIIETYKK